MKRTSVLGIDPGAHGAVAVVTAQGELSSVEDMPTVKRKRGKRIVTEIDTIALASLLSKPWPHFACIEKVAARPGQGVSSMFAFGRSVGQVEGALAVLGMPTEYVTPQVWRRGVGAGDGKGGSRARAQALFPAHAGRFVRVKDDGRADAALIAWWAHQNRWGAL